MGKVAVSVVPGDITQVKAEALITSIHSDKIWTGKIDDAIRRVAGSFFHLQIIEEAPLRDGQTVVARSNGRYHAGAFRDVIFVVDNLDLHSGFALLKGLRSASVAGFESVSFPVLRTKELGQPEKSAEEVVEGIATGVLQFTLMNPDTTIESITFVVYGDPEIVPMLQQALK